jgi:alkylhydroperoxidase family enzyme
MSMIGFLSTPPTTEAAQRLFDEDVAEDGYVSNVSKLWAYQPELVEALFEVMRKAVKDQSLSFRQRGVLVAASVSTLGDSYCSVAWGEKLAAVTDADLAAGVLRGDDSRLEPDERALAVWARKVVADPNGIVANDVSALREAAFTDAQIFAITAFVALRLAFSTVNDALGAQPDGAFRASAPAQVRDAITWGRAIEPSAS